MKQATFITGLSCVGFAVGLAAFIGSRLSEQAIALMAGAVFGMLVAMPIGALIGWAVKGSRSIERSSAPAQPMVIMTPPQLPANMQYLPPAANSAWPNSYPVAGPLRVLPAAGAPLQPRKYTIGGEEIIHHESAAVW